MRKQKIVLTGASGFLGYHFLDESSDDYQITGVYSNTPVIGFPNIQTKKIDFRKPKESQNFYDYLITERPDFVINFAASANPNFCELNPEISKIINVDLPTSLAKICQELNIKLVHTSTDLVFDGEKGNYSENDPISPISIYGEHKAKAEESIKKFNPSALITRLPLMFGITARETGFFQNWVEKLKLNQPIYAFTDEYRTAASAKRVVKGLKTLIDESATGIWHLGGKESLSRYEFAKRLSKYLKIRNPKIIPSIRADVQMPAARPKDVSLNSKKAKQIGYYPLILEEEFEHVFKSKSI